MNFCQGFHIWFSHLNWYSFFVNEYTLSDWSYGQIISSNYVPTNLLYARDATDPKKGYCNEKDTFGVKMERKPNLVIVQYGLSLIKPSPQWPAIEVVKICNIYV